MNNLKKSMNKLISNILKENEEDIDDFFKPKNLKSREEKLEKRLKIECQKKFHMSIDELKNIYFSLYDQMKEPEKSQAKNNFDIERTMEYPIPETISDAIEFGFQWVKTPEGFIYWDKIHNRYNP